MTGLPSLMVTTRPETPTITTSPTMTTSTIKPLHQRSQNHHPTGPRQRSRPLVGNFEESILNNRLQPDRVVEDYSLEVRSAHYNRSLKSKVRVSFFSAGDCFPYLGQAHIGQRAFKIPKKGTLQVTLFNPNGTLVKLFLLHYDLTDMPPNSQTFLRQKTLLLIQRPTQTINISPLTVAKSTNNGSVDNLIGNPTAIRGQHHHQQQRVDDGHVHGQKLKQATTRVLPPSNITKDAITPPGRDLKRRIKYMIQLNIVSSKSNRIYLNKDLRIFISKKMDLETATQFAKQDYELKSVDEMPSDPKYFSR